MSYGRGGSGNIAVSQALAEASESKNSTNQSKTSKPQSGQGGTVNLENQQALSGRGGAGNLVTSQSLPLRALQAQQQRHAFRVQHQPDDSRAYGRGGAGNFDSVNLVEKQREEALKKKLEQIRQLAEKDVDIGLQRPDKVVVRHAEEKNDTL